MLQEKPIRNAREGKRGGEKKIMKKYTHTTWKTTFLFYFQLREALGEKM